MTVNPSVHKPFLRCRRALKQGLRWSVALLLGGLDGGIGGVIAANGTPPPPSTVSAPAPSPARQTVSEPALYITEYRVEGARSLPKAEVEAAVYPFLGPGRTEADVEQARVALDKAYREKGLQAVDVRIPEQNAGLLARGIVLLQVTEGAVGRLRVKGARYFLPGDIKRAAPSLAEGKVIDFNNITREIMSLNRLPDRQAKPELRAGTEPGTVDIDLIVKDRFPLHGSVEFNNRYNANTTPYRINGALSYGNLWQSGHTLGMSFQVAPERIDDAAVYSAYYLVPVPRVDGLSLMVQGTRQNSNVASLGTLDSIGRGQTIEGRAILSLPPGTDFFHSISLGIDYKHYAATDVTATSGTATAPLAPVTYFPISAMYSANWTGRNSTTDLNFSVTLNLRGVSSVPQEGSGWPTAFNNLRYNADDNFIYLRGDLSHSHDLPAGFQVFGKVEGQLSNEPLVPGEQFGGGGLDSVRGYLESTALGDNGFVGTVELRSPSLGGLLHTKAIEDWRFFVFCDGGLLSICNPLPEQKSRFYLASVGGGTRFKVENHFNGVFTLGLPLLAEGTTRANNLLFTFRLWADF